MFKSSSSKKRKRETGTVSSWIESTFSRRDCNRFLPSAKDNSRCCCGNLWQYHSDGSPATLQHTVKGDDHWNPLRHTTLHATDAYGTIEFQGGAHPSKAQYVRVAYDTRPEQLLQLLVSAWRLELPKLLITVHGGKANFELQPKLKKALRRGLLKAARTTGAWVFTGGTNTGVTRHAGDALASGQSLRLGGQRAVCIGIAPWGVIEGRHEQLVGRNREVPYHVAQGRFSRCAPLNSRHTHFLLADNGTAGRYGAEYIMRRALEKHISSQRYMSRLGQGTPLVCVVIEGGTNTIRAILEYVTDSPPVPVVVCDGTGRASDIVSFVYRHMHSSNGSVILGMPEMRENLVSTVKETFGLARQEQAEKLLAEIIQCCRHKELITVYRYQEGLELDEAMLKALLQGYHMCSTDQLNLALSWNRVDIARCTVFATPHDWPPGSLEQAMMDALVNDRIDFVKLLLENGVMMSKFLTLERLEELYNAKQGPPNSLHYIIQDVRKNYSRGRHTLLDIGLVINHLMGGAFRSTYSRRKFRALYYETFRFRSPMIVRNASMFMRAAACATTAVAAAAPLKMSPPANGKAHQDGSPSPARSRVSENVFEYPFSELMIWAVLTKRQAMAHLMWQHGEEALAKALVACKLFKALSCEAAEDNLETEFFEDLKRHATEFENLALDVLDFVYQHNQDVAQQLLTYELRNWSRQTCLSLAVTADHKRLLAHPSCQVLLAELWMGGLNLRRNTHLKVLLSVLFPPAMLQLEFRTQEELRQMPQTEEEYLMEHCEEEEDGSEEDDDDPAGADEGLVPSPSPRRVSVSVPAGTLPLNNHPPSPSGLADFADGRKNNQLGLRKKIYEFYTAPVTKFWSFTLAYIVFLTLYTFVVLVKMYPIPRWQEIYVSVFIVTAGIEKCREIMISEPVSLNKKLAHWFSRTWNLMDAIFIVAYLMAQPLRYNASTFRWGRSLICCNNMYWHIRLFEIFSVEKYLGPMVTMVGKMTVKMLHFIVLLVIILFSFGVLRQSIRFPNEEPDWYLLRHVFYQPYFMLYGEVYAPEIEPEMCGEEEGLEDCHFWITVVAMAAYLLVANILMLNMMIAVFNNIFASINAVSHEVWMFHRYRLVMEYEVRPVCPPPFIFIAHLYMLLKFIWNRCRRDSASYDHGLKLFLDEEALENVHDFEEECLEAYFRQKEFESLHKTDQLVQQTWERQEQIYQRLEDVLQREFVQVEATRLVDYRLKRLEEMFGGVERMATATHAMLRQHTGLTSTVPDAPPTRPRYSSTGSVGLDDDAFVSGGVGGPGSRTGSVGGGGGGGIVGLQEEENAQSSMVQELARIALSHGPRRRRSKLDSSSRMPRVGSSCSQSSLGSVPVAPMSAAGSIPPSPGPLSAAGSGVPSLSEPDGRRTSVASEPSVRQRPEIYVLPPSSPTLDLPLGEYRSITDSLESRCRVELGPVSVCVEPPPPATPTTPRASSPTTQQMLTSAEDGDYQMMELLIQRRMRRPSENLDVSLEDLTRLLGEWPAGAAPGGAERRPSAGPPLLSAVPEHSDNESELSEILTFRATPTARRAGADGTGATSSPAPTSSTAPGTPSPASTTPPPARDDPGVPQAPQTRPTTPQAPLAGPQAPSEVPDPVPAAAAEERPGVASRADPAPSPPPDTDTQERTVDSRRSSQCSHQETRC